MSPQFKTILVNLDKGVLHITLNRPEKRNALNENMVKELHEIFNRFRIDEKLKGAIITGSGKAFCAGADLAYLQALQEKTQGQNYQDSVNLMNMYWSIYSFPKPTLALVNGPAIAGGCGLMTVCDLAIASKESVFAYPEVKIGFVAALVSVFLVQLVGYRQAKRLLISGQTLNAPQAKSLGLVSDVVEKSMLTRAASDFFEEIGHNSRQAMELTKELILKQWGQSLFAKLEEACYFNTQSRQTADFKEGLAAFLEKRKAAWEE